MACAQSQLEIVVGAHPLIAKATSNIIIRKFVNFLLRFQRSYFGLLRFDLILAPLTLPAFEKDEREREYLGNYLGQCCPRAAHLLDELASQAHRASRGCDKGLRINPARGRHQRFRQVSPAG